MLRNNVFFALVSRAEAAIEDKAERSPVGFYIALKETDDFISMLEIWEVAVESVGKDG